ncbi:MAG: hypothetical protein CL840_17945 [Crocinitomicaceae bacterium]|nr:hypothetical protein [Crocinitomicaceae bacterium]|tara:strand:+ start:13252 stop:13851 length:600 start_codon:yes stop_codon:yes gene_type:complete
MRVLFCIWIVTGMLACSNDTSTESGSSFQEELKEFRKERNKKMAGSDSPLAQEDRKHFVGLNYYPANDTFLIQAKFELLFSQQAFEMATNTDRKPKYIPFGKILFSIDNKGYSLTAYKSLEHSGNELFVPFNDLTNGIGSYETGRYMDIKVPDGDSIVLDFNRCYNPYCAYNSKYSCPIPPAANSLNIQINAGEAKFHH